jgi:RHS repeat-associated protein
VTFVSQAAPIATSAPSGFTYDAAGDVVADANNSYAYDGEGRLCAVYNSLTGSKTQYVYDASGGRVAKASFTGTFPAKNTVCAAPGAAAGFTLTAQYLLDQGGDQVTELNGSGAWQHSNVWAGSHLDATYDAKGLHFHLADPLGTRRIQTNIDGQVEESCQSLPFGDNLNCTTTALTTADDATEHHFTGKEHDAESGNDYFDARYYNSTMGRFMSPDWSAQEEPIPYAKLDDPQSLNLYAYVENNPLDRMDVDGHTPDVTFESKELEDDFDDMAAKSPSFKTELDAAKADHRMEVRVHEPDAIPMPDHAPADTKVTARLDGTGQVKVDISVRPGDKDAQAHEMGHEKDARTNTAQLMKDGKKTADDKGGPAALPHNDRPEEKRADAFKKVVLQELKTYKQEQKRKKKDGGN